MSEIRRRVRKRGEKEVLINPVIQEEEASSVPILKEEPEEEELDNFMTREQLAKAQKKYQIRKTINEINADITDDKRSQLVESNFWDETHNWGSDDEVESDDYWHFLGRYE